MHRRGGLRSHSGMVSSGWEVSTVRLLWNIRRGWTLHHSVSRRQSRRFHGTLIRRVACGSLGSARAISGRGTDLTPGPESLPSAGANHGGRLSTGVGLKWGGAAGASCRCAAAGEVEGICGRGLLRLELGGGVQDFYRACGLGGVEG